MHDIVTTFEGLVPVASSCLGASVLTGGLVALLRGRTASPCRAASERARTRAAAVTAALIDTSLVFSGLFAAYLVFSPEPDSGERIPVGRIRPHPGDDLRTALRAVPGDVHPWVQLFGNLLLLFPLGVLLPMRVEWLGSVPRVAVAALVGSVSVELLQFLVVAGRVASTDDVVLNTLGAATGAVLTPHLRRVGRRWAAPRRTAPQHSATGQGLYPVWWLIAEVERERPAVARTRSGLQWLPVAAPSSPVAGRRRTGVRPPLPPPVRPTRRPARGRS